MISIAICDDDPAQVRALKKMLTEWGRPVAVREYGSAGQFLYSYPDAPCDLLLLDIEMGEMNGMELARALRDRGDTLPIIFITGYTEFMQDGFEVEALHYLLKPVDRARLFAALDRYADRHARERRLIFPSGDGSVCIDADDIVFLEAFGKKTQITLRDGRELLCSCGLRYAAEKLKEGFVSCHRSYVVNIGCIRAISKTEITLEGGKKIPLSRRLYEDVNRAFIGFYMENRQ